MTPPLVLQPAPRCRLFVLQPSPFCNLDCSYCYLPNRSDKTRMGEETLRRAFQRLLRVSPSAYREAFARAPEAPLEVHA